MSWRWCRLCMRSSLLSFVIHLFGIIDYEVILYCARGINKLDLLPNFRARFPKVAINFAIEEYGQYQRDNY
jgi:hypothetical protein